MSLFLLLDTIPITKSGGIRFARHETRTNAKAHVTKHRDSNTRPNARPRLYKPKKTLKQ